jgi:hypothetical protein
VLVCATSASSADPSNLGARQTTIHLYAPFNGAGIAAGVKVTSLGRGYCWENSLADGRQDAFRCFIGNGIYDPCFANTIIPSNFVLCPGGRPDAGVTKLILTKKLPRAYPNAKPTHHPPWVVRTSTGKWCGIITGATGDVSGLSIRYACTGGGILLGNPTRRTASAWTIFYATGYKANQFRPITLTAAWW